MKTPVAISERPTFTSGNSVLSVFASDVLTPAMLRTLIPECSYQEFLQCVSSGQVLPISLADQVASAMKEWAVQRGATHYTHFFLPLTSATAEKHDSFLKYAQFNPLAVAQQGLQVIMNFSGKELIRGEPDASSFPSGGLRSTAEARGYTTWDMSSAPFLRTGINGKTLMIPTAFCSWNGEALDKKTPLLRSQESLSRAGINLLRVLGDQTSQSVHTTVGAEQEFFLIDRDMYLARPDLIFTGRTLIGARPPKGQELEEHYFGKIPPRVLAFFNEVESELWRLGVPVKTRHNEVAPCQFELAPIFESSNVALDHNQLTMDVLREVATKHGFACLLHEKPFAYVNGSGKHNNWALSTETGDNLLEPGSTPRNNLRFMVFLAIIIRAIDLHADLLRASIATPGNDHRLGANEAPPGIISIFLGQELDGICRDIQSGPSPTSPKARLTRRASTIALGVGALPRLPRDTTDRNRTSPFAFTGNKFEFRAVGSSQSLDISTLTLNTITAESCQWFADEIEKRVQENPNEERNHIIQELVAETMRKHYRIVNNGNNYTEEWQKEAERRGLLNCRTGIEALKAYENADNMELFDQFGVFTPAEFQSRSTVYSENFLKQIQIEVRTQRDLVKTSVLPAAIRYQQQLASSIAAAASALPAEIVDSLLKPQRDILIHVVNQVNALQALVDQMPTEADHDDDTPVQEALRQYFPKAFEAMEQVRTISDDLESRMDKSLWTLPRYSDMLFSVE